MKWDASSPPGANPAALKNLRVFRKFRGLSGRRSKIVISRHVHEDLTFELRRAASLHGATILGHGGAYDYYIGMLRMPKGFDLRCGAGKTARVWVPSQSAYEFHIPLVECLD